MVLSDEIIVGGHCPPLPSAHPHYPFYICYAGGPEKREVAYCLRDQLIELYQGQDSSLPQEPVFIKFLNMEGGHDVLTKMYEAAKYSTVFIALVDEEFCTPGTSGNIGPGYFCAEECGQRTGNYQNSTLLVFNNNKRLDLSEHAANNFGGKEIQVGDWNTAPDLKKIASSALQSYFESPCLQEVPRGCTMRKQSAEVEKKVHIVPSSIYPEFSDAVQDACNSIGCEDVSVGSDVSDGSTIVFVLAEIGSNNFDIQSVRDYKISRDKAVLAEFTEKAKQYEEEEKTYSDNSGRIGELSSEELAIHAGFTRKEYPQKALDTMIFPFFEGDCFKSGSYIGNMQGCTKVVDSNNEVDKAKILSVVTSVLNQDVTQRVA